MRISQHFIDDLINKTDILTVIGSRMKLKKTGANYSACCPFHSEKSPSFTVAPHKQFYHCFGCGAHGTAVGFLMEHQGMDYVTAIKALAADLGMDVEYESPSGGRVQKSILPDLRAINTKAAKLYWQQLRTPAGEAGMSYFAKRGIDEATATHFQLGFAPKSAILTELPTELRLQSGLSFKDDNGRLRDYFYNRVMFPILDANSQIIGFGGRALDNGKPKYLNSPETPLFQKGRELFGLPQAQKAIRDENRVVVAEGYMDVIAAHQFDYLNIVATLGTATTATHIQRLFRMCDHIVFCFDGDAAGHKAAQKAMENALPCLSDGKSLSFVFLPDQHDPDSFIREKGVDAFAATVAAAQPLSEYLVDLLKRECDINTPEGRSAFLSAAHPLIESIAAPAFKLLISKHLAEVAKVSEGEMSGIMAAMPPVTSKQAARPQRQPVALSAVLTDNTKLLACLLADPIMLKGNSGRALDATADLDPAARALVDWAKEYHDKPTTPVVINAFMNTPFEQQMMEAESLLMQLGDGFDYSTELDGLLSRMKQNNAKGELETLNAKIAAGGIKALGERERERYRLLVSSASRPQAPRA